MKIVRLQTIIYMRGPRVGGGGTGYGRVRAVKSHPNPCKIQISLNLYINYIRKFPKTYLGPPLQSHITVGPPPPSREFFLYPHMIYTAVGIIISNILYSYKM